MQKLKTKYLSDEYYILKQSILEFDQFAILFCNAGQTRKRVISRQNNKYFLEGESELKFENINSIIKYMADVRALLPKHPVKVKPQQGNQIYVKLCSGTISTSHTFKEHVSWRVAKNFRFIWFYSCPTCKRKCRSNKQQMLGCINFIWLTERLLYCGTDFNVVGFN